jgi:hypothetical protein
VLVARSSDPPGTPTIVAADAWSTSAARTAPDLRVSLVHEVTRAGAHLDLRWDTSDGLEILRAVPVTSGRGAASGVLGVFVFARKGGEAFTTAECDLMDEFADRVALALKTLPAHAS